MRLLLLLTAAILFVAAAFSVFMFHQNYWRYRSDFNEEGRYFDAAEGVVYHAQSGMIWGVLGAAALVVALVLWFKNRR